MPDFRAPTFRSLSWPQVRELVMFAARRLHEERLPQVAGSLTFTTVLALVPILTIALAIFTSFPLFNTFRSALEAYFIKSLMPQAIANTILVYLSQFATKATRLSAVGAVALIFTAVFMVAIIDRTFNRIWRVRRPRPLAQRILIYWAVVTLGPLLIGVSITVTSYLFTATNDVVGKLPFAGTVFFTLVSLFLTCGTFTLIYMAVPNRFVDWRDAAGGAMVAAIAFELTKRLFAVFVAKFSTYTAVYGALAAVPIFLVWIYLGWLIALSGAVLAASLPVVKYERWRHVPTAGSAFVDAMAVLKVLHEARSESAVASLDTARMRERTRLGFDELDGLLHKMLAQGWVGRIDGGPPRRMQFGKRISDGLERWVLLANPDQLTLADVYRLFVFDAVGNSALSRQVEAAVERGLGESLSAYFDAGAAPASSDALRPVLAR
jgi:membrane protein